MSRADVLVATGPDALVPWMRACAGGDSEAFSVLYTALFPRVRATAWGVLRDVAQAEEVAQEVIAEVWSSSGRFCAERGTVAGWVIAIAHRRAVDRSRSRTRASRREQQYARLATTPDYDSVVEQVLYRLDADEVRRCLERLTDLQRQALTLVYLDGTTHADGAARLGVPLGTFKTRVRDALERLRRDLLG
ncbi:MULTISPECIES: sigma-70 family RNA polymerase sigma factor [Streptomyces]|nr:RNA polymerase sigma-70 factor, ECF subfamily [Streptomyces sp. SolWspMP-5a-2]